VFGLTEAEGLTKDQYRYRILEHSRISANSTLFSGHEFEGLAGFLTRSMVATRHRSSRSLGTLSVSDQDFAIVYEWDGSSRTPEPRRITRPLPSLPSTCTSPSGVIVFLTGYQTADWVLDIGSFYDVDPEFFRRHLDFLHTSRRSGRSQASQVPSFQKNILRLLITTVGRHDNSASKNIITERSQASEGMRSYMRSLRDTERWTCGSPVVRSFALHDLEEFSIQQAATITLCRSDRCKNSWLCLVWLDSGYDIFRGPQGPWLGDDGGQSIVFEPVPLNKPYVSLKKHWSNSDLAPRRLSQSLSVLPYAYGKMTNPSTARNDPFYALNELFTMTVSSELRFLNAIEDKIYKNIETSSEKPKDAMRNHADLSYLSRIIGEHVESLSDTSSFVESRVFLKWPRDNGNHAESTAIWLQNDLNYVLKKAQTLQITCVREMDMIMAQSALEEAKLSVSQNQRVLKLTILAFFFAPLAFTTSLFGMNFVEPGANKGPWLVVTIAVPLVALAMMVVVWDQLFVKNLVLAVTRKLHSMSSVERRPRAINVDLG